MPVLSDFFVAPLDEVLGFDAKRSPESLFPSIRAKGVEIVKLVQLQCIVEGSTFDDHLADLDSLFLRTEAESGPWVLTVPKTLQQSLATASEAELENIGQRWAATDEWIRDSGNPHEVAQLVREVAGLARKMKELVGDMYLWVSL